MVASAARHGDLEGTTPTLRGMQVEQLWRHPVKSLQGERLLEAALSETGLRHDREYGVIDRRTGRVLSGKTVPQLMFGRARLDGDTVVVALPGGSDFAADDPAGAVALSGWLDRDVFLEHAGDLPRAFQVQEVVSDSEPSPNAPVRDVLCPPAPSGLRARSPRRRGLAARRGCPAVSTDGAGPRARRCIDANDSGSEDDWLGRTVRIGSAELRIVKPTKRCAIVQRPQPGLARDVPLARSLIHDHGNMLGVYATVVTPGRMALGDSVRSG